MAEFPEDVRYTRDHEWTRPDGGDLVVGITDHAQEALGDVVYVELPAVGSEVRAGRPFGVVESVKSVSDLCAPLDGRVTAVNEALAERPEAVNEDPYGAGWMIRLEPAPGTDAGGLLDAASYRALVEGGGG